MGLSPRSHVVFILKVILVARKWGKTWCSYCLWVAPSGCAGCAQPRFANTGRLSNWLPQKFEQRINGKRKWFGIAVAWRAVFQSVLSSRKSGYAWLEFAGCLPGKVLSSRTQRFCLAGVWSVPTHRFLPGSLSLFSGEIWWDRWWAIQCLQISYQPAEESFDNHPQLLFKINSDIKAPRSSILLFPPCDAHSSWGTLESHTLILPSPHCVLTDGEA